jgi:hypothetical protein
VIRGVSEVEIDQQFLIIRNLRAMSRIRDRNNQTVKTIFVIWVSVFLFFIQNFDFYR